jgi:hypothetical protein
MKVPLPMPVGPNDRVPTWVLITAALFGAIILLGMVALVPIAASDPNFVCYSFTPLAAAFAIGSALSTSFIGGAASLRANLPPTGTNVALALSAGGGIAVLFGAFLMFEHYQPAVCDLAIAGLNQKVLTLTSELNTLKTGAITIIIPDNSGTSALIDQIAVDYIDTKGNAVEADRDDNQFTIELKKLAGEIFVTYKAALRPAQRQNAPARFSIDQFSYTSPTRLRLWLNDPSSRKEPNQ